MISKKWLAEIMTEIEGQVPTPERPSVKQTIIDRTDKLVDLLAYQDVDPVADEDHAAIKKSVYQLPDYRGPVMHGYVIAERVRAINSDDPAEDTYYSRLSLVDSIDEDVYQAALLIIADKDWLSVTAYNREMHQDSPDEWLGHEMATQFLDWFEARVQYLKPVLGPTFPATQ